MALSVIRLETCDGQSLPVLQVGRIAIEALLGSRDHLFPSVCRRLSRKGLPHVGILLTVGLILVFLLFDPANIAKLASAFQLLVFASLCVAVIVMPVTASPGV